MVYMYHSFLWIRVQFFMVAISIGKWEVNGDVTFDVLYGLRFLVCHLLVTTLSHTKPCLLPEATSFRTRPSLDFRGRTDTCQDEIS